MMVLSEYLEGSDALSLSRACVRIYQTLSRNTPMGISIWRRYLTDARYQGNKLTFEIGKSMTQSDMVSRANYKLILAVLAQKNGFMKIGRLKDLLGKGTLSSPILPHKGKWRSIIRLDPFALKRANKESGGLQQPQIENKPSNLITGPSTEAFLCQLAGQKSKRVLLTQFLEKYLTSGPHAVQLQTLVEVCISAGNLAGLGDILSLARLRVSDSDFQNVVKSCVFPFRTPLGNCILHELLRDPKLVLSEKVRVVLQLLELPVFPSLLNEVNLSHETPLVLAMKIDRIGLHSVCSRMLAVGADPSLCDSHGVFFTPLD